MKDFERTSSFSRTPVGCTTRRNLPKGPLLASNGPKMRVFFLLGSRGEGSKSQLFGVSHCPKIDPGYNGPLLFWVHGQALWLSLVWKTKIVLSGSLNFTVAFTFLQGKIPPTINLSERTEEFDMDYVANKAQDWNSSTHNRRIALTNSFGFGGTNASLCIASV